MVGTGSFVSKLAAVDVLLSLLRRATGPELASLLFAVPDEVARPSLLRARLPEDIVRVRPFCRGKDDDSALDIEEEMTGSGRFKVSTVGSEHCCW